MVSQWWLMMWTDDSSGWAGVGFKSIQTHECDDKSQS